MSLTKYDYYGNYDKEDDTFYKCTPKVGKKEIE